MKTYSVHEAKTQLSKLIQRALSGEDVVITNRKKPVVKLTVIKQPKRKLGFMGASGVWISKDFNSPLVGRTANRPAPTNGAAGAFFIDQTIGAALVSDGISWRNLATGMPV